MSVKVEKDTPSVVDKGKWALVWLSLLFAVALSVLSTKQEEWVRFASWTGVLLFAVFVGLSTVKGKAFREFARQANSELRKVVWPTKPEMTQTTMGVFMVLVIASFLLWLIDLGLFHLVRQLMGQRGLA